jgi:hypothetical protein
MSMLGYGLVSRHHMVLVIPADLGSDRGWPSCGAAGQPSHVVQDPEMVFHLPRSAFGVPRAHAGKQPPV